MTKETSNENDFRYQLKTVADPDIQLTGGGGGGGVTMNVEFCEENALFPKKMGGGGGGGPSSTFVR